MKYGKFLYGTNGGRATALQNDIGSTTDFFVGYESLGSAGETEHYVVEKYINVDTSPTL